MTRSAVPFFLASLALVVIVLGFYLWLRDEIPANRSPSALHSPMARVPQASAYTDAAVPVTPESSPEDSKQGTAQKSADAGASHEVFAQLLHDYRSTGLDPDDRILIEQFLREWNASEMGRAFIVETFFSTQEPELAESLYNLILDADIKDLELIVELIQRDGSEQNLQAKTRIVDLIADLTAQEESPYSREIDEYLAQLALHPDAELRNTAKTQRAWYVTRLQAGRIDVLKDYLLDSAPAVRDEMFELLESRAASLEETDRLDLVLTLKSLLYADYLEVKSEERARIQALIDTMSDE